MIYLIDKPMAEIAFRTAAGDEDAEIVLVQDGVFLDPDLEVPTYAVRRDVEVRGVDLPARIEPIDYDDVVELTLERGVRSFV
jgi:tRNA 2-thiouridine synthesizing protein B